MVGAEVERACIRYSASNITATPTAPAPAPLSTTPPSYLLLPPQLRVATAAYTIIIPPLLSLLYTRSCALSSAGTPPSSGARAGATREEAKKAGACFSCSLSASPGTAPYTSLLYALSNSRSASGSSAVSGPAVCQCYGVRGGGEGVSQSHE